MRIGLIGDHISDEYIYGKMNRFSPESPIPIFDVTDKEYKFGGASNVNSNLIALGAKVDYHCDNKDYSVKKRYVCDNHILFRVDEDKISKDFNFDNLNFSEETKHIILSDYNKGMLSKSQQLIDYLKQKNKIVIVDPKKSLDNYKGADIIKMNESEYQKFSIFKDYQKTRSFYNIGTLVITMADKGATVVGENIQTIPGESKQVADVTGAGDVFIAAMTYYFAKGESIYNSCKIANKLAGISVCKFGTYILTSEDINFVEKCKI